MKEKIGELKHLSDQSWKGEDKYRFEVRLKDTKGQWMCAHFVLIPGAHIEMWEDEHGTSFTKCEDQT